MLGAFSALLSLSPNRAGHAGQLILAGDPQQLGPIVRGDAVDDEHGGLSISLLERLIKTHPAYTRNLDEHFDSAGYNPRVLTMLLNCYRCHPDILKLPNELFYHGALVAAADRLVTHNMGTWPGLPTRNFPLVFHGVEGENKRESNSPSWFNVEEIEIVWKYVRDLVDNFRVAPADIAVITPYHKQVTKIKQLLRQNQHHGAYQDVAVGSCEQMQGQERRVIIISTVRSSTEYLEQDRLFNLGFVTNPKRFNVAVTRAKALLIVVGNPHVLNSDRHWRRLLHFCIERGGYTGCTPPEADDGPGAGAGDAGEDGPADDAPGGNVPPPADGGGDINLDNLEHAFDELDIDFGDDDDEEGDQPAGEAHQEEGQEVGWVHLEM